MPILYRNEGVEAVYEVGEYWDKSVQIDVVGLRDDGWTDLGECKWGAYGGQAALRHELEAKLSRYPNQRGATLRRYFFVQNRPQSSGRLGERWYGLRELYGAGG